MENDIKHNMDASNINLLAAMEADAPVVDKIMVANSNIAYRLIKKGMLDIMKLFEPSIG